MRLIMSPRLFCSFYQMALKDTGTLVFLLLLTASSVAGLAVRSNKECLDFKNRDTIFTVTPIKQTSCSRVHIQTVLLNCNYRVALDVLFCSPRFSTFGIKQSDVKLDGKRAAGWRKILPSSGAAVEPFTLCQQLAKIFRDMYFVECRVWIRVDDNAVQSCDLSKRRLMKTCAYRYISDVVRKVTEFSARNGENTNDKSSFKDEAESFGRGRKRQRRNSYCTQCESRYQSGEMQKGSTEFNNCFRQCNAQPEVVPVEQHEVPSACNLQLKKIIPAFYFIWLPITK